MLSTTAMFFGSAASLILVTGMFPQILKVYKMREAGEISWGWLFLGSFGSALWIAYGIVQSEMVVLITNICMLANFLVLCGLKLKYGRS